MKILLFGWSHKLQSTTFARRESWLLNMSVQVKIDGVGGLTGTKELRRHWSGHNRRGLSDADGDEGNRRRHHRGADQRDGDLARKWLMGNGVDGMSRLSIMTIVRSSLANIVTGTRPRLTVSVIVWGSRTSFWQRFGHIQVVELILNLSGAVLFVLAGLLRGRVG